MGKVHNFLLTSAAEWSLSVRLLELDMFLFSDHHELRCKLHIPFFLAVSSHECPKILYLHGEWGKEARNTLMKDKTS